MQSKDNEKEGQEFFEKFGYTEDMQYIESLNQKIQTNIKINIAIIILFGVCIIFICLNYISDQNKQIMVTIN